MWEPLHIALLLARRAYNLVVDEFLEFLLGIGYVRQGLHRDDDSDTEDA
jgi:hypothetical protein